jgi:hypothetical protein
VGTSSREENASKQKGWSPGFPIKPARLEPFDAGMKAMTRPTAALKRAAADPAARDSVNDGVDIGMLDDWIGFHLRMAQIASFQSFARHAQGIELSPGRFAALVLIDRNPDGA